jgi:hypothetical protein
VGDELSVLDEDEGQHYGRVNVGDQLLEEAEDGMSLMIGGWRWEKLMWVLIGDKVAARDPFPARGSRPH